MNHRRLLQPAALPVHLFPDHLLLHTGHDGLNSRKPALYNKQMFFKTNKMFFMSKNNKTASLSPFLLKNFLMLTMSMVNLLFMHYTIILTCHTEIPLESISWIDNLCAVIFDTVIIFFISLLLMRKKIRPALATTFIITLAWAFTNIFYARFFNSYIRLSSIGQSASLIDPIVIKSMLQGLRWIDLLFLLFPTVFCILYRAPKAYISSQKMVVYSVVFLLAMIFVDLLAHAIFCLADPKTRYFSYYSYRIQSRHINEHTALCEPITSTFQRGSIRTLLLECINNMRADMELSKEQRIEIQTAIQQSRKSIHAINCEGKDIENIIFIIVESYMAFTSDLTIDGQEITPNLNALRHDSTTFFNRKMQANITIGESADGQYIYMTGLLPMRSMITISGARSKTLPGLPKLLRQKGMTSRMIIPTSPNMWNQTEMCRQYGFEQLYSCKDYKDGTLTALSDQQVFELAASKDMLSPHGFFSTILTMSMHQPYTTTVDPTFILHDNTLSNELKNYLNACHYTDRCIGEYLNRLKDMCIYEKSLIFITADHHVHNTTFGPDITNDLPLYIINIPINKKNAWEGICNQIDVYPTLLNLIDFSSEWYGLGYSLLNPSYSNSLSSNKWDISEWILLSDYFNDSKHAQP